MNKNSIAFVRVAIGILVFGALLIGWHATPLVSSSPSSVSPAASPEPPEPPEPPFPFDIFLPIISYEGGGTVPVPTSTPEVPPEKRRKVWSGIHLGNKGRSGVHEWSKTELQRIDPDAAPKGQDAIWPSMIVVLSNQIYNIERAETDLCNIQHADIRLPYTLDYLKRATLAGSKVVIRIYPSPGNFKDWAITDPADPGYRQNRVLIASRPAGGDNCRPALYRSPQDLADEMAAIHALNVANGFSEFGFEPANEPNIEWYDSIVSRPENFKPEVWVEMNRYFSKIYELSLDDDFRIFTPPMAQSQFADGIDLGSCNDRYLYSESDQKVTGYWHLRELIAKQSHGFSWHNYWDWGKETYTSCRQGGQHISYHFPQWMKDLLRQMGKPMILSEADLFSPLQQPGTPLKDKNSGDYATADEISASLQRFFATEWRDGGHGDDSHYGVDPDLALWLLNDNTCNEGKCPADDTCRQNYDPNAAGYCALDHNWHEAYRDVDDKPSEERAWFGAWYLGTEAP